MRYWLIALLSVACLAQSQGNAPQAVDSWQDAGRMNGGIGACTPGDTDCANAPEGVNNNDLIVCSKGQEDVTDGCVASGGSNPPWTFSDSASFTWTRETSHNNGGTAGTSSNMFQQMAYTCATSSQTSYQVHVTGNAPPCQTNFTCVRIKNACTSGTITQDAFQQNTFTISGTGITTLTNTLTTTRLNDLIVSGSQPAPNNGTGSTLQPIGLLSLATGDQEANSVAQDLGSLAWGVAPTLGSNSFSWKNLVAIHNTTQQQTIAFQIPITLGDSALPQAAVGVAYKAQLHTYGGLSSSPTYACTGLPASGLSLNTATGLISGTATGTGTLSLGCTSTDGTNTSATDTLSLQIVSSFPIPFVAATPTLTGLGGGGGSITVPGGVCGDVVVLQPQAADDTHGSVGYLQAINGTGNYVHSSDNSPVQRCFVGSGLWNGPQEAWVIGPLNTTGPQTITVANNTAAASALVVLATDVRGAQAICSAPSINSDANTTASGTLSTSYTTLVPNELVLAQTEGWQQGSNQFTAMTFSAPLSSVNSGSGTYIFGGFGSGVIPTPSTITATTNLTETGPGDCGGTFTYCDAVSTLVMSLRPGTDTACPVFSGAGEKFKRYVN